MAVFGFDAYSPAEIARRVNEVGVAKAHLPIEVAGTSLLLGGCTTSQVFPATQEQQLALRKGDLENHGVAFITPRP